VLGACSLSPSSFLTHSIYCAVGATQYATQFSPCCMILQFLNGQRHWHWVWKGEWNVEFITEKGCRQSRRHGHGCRCGCGHGSMLNPLALAKTKRIVPSTLAALQQSWIKKQPTQDYNNKSHFFLGDGPSGRTLSPIYALCVF